MGAPRWAWALLASCATCLVLVTWWAQPPVAVGQLGLSGLAAWARRTASRGWAPSSPATARSSGATAVADKSPGAQHTLSLRAARVVGAAGLPATPTRSGRGKRISGHAHDRVRVADVAAVQDGPASDASGEPSSSSAAHAPATSSAAPDDSPTAAEPQDEALLATKRLTRELVASVARDNVVMVTWANHHYLEFVTNWVAHVERLGIAAYLVGAMDDALLRVLVGGGVNCFRMASGLSLGDFGWGSPTFHKMGREKINLIRAFTSMGFDILVTDVDTVWMRDPLPYMARWPEADVLSSSDHLAPTAADEGLEHWPQAASAANIGIMLFRARAAALAQEWSEVLAQDDKVWDQNAFNDLFRRGLRVPDPPRPDRLFLGFDERLKIGILPVALFCSGHTFFVQRLPERRGQAAYAVHATFQFSGTPGKRHRFRERLLWQDPPEYFRHPGGYLAYTPDLPPALLAQAPPASPDMSLANAAGHFHLVNHQLLQLRGALAVAGALGRALVLPQLWCGQDRWWAPHGGTIPGAALALPFPCPADHVLDLEQMSRQLPADEFGPDIAFRESSFLNNTRLPPDLLAASSTVRVQVCARDEPGCADGSAPAQVGEGGLVRLAAGLTDRQLAGALGNLTAPLVTFDTMLAAFGSHALPEDAARFERRTQLYGSLWCCMLAHPGHIWYDFWWDRPHTDRHQRRVEHWQPVPGP